MRLSTRRLLLTDEDRKAEITVPQLLEAGGWAAVFGTDAPITVEIGLGKDTHLLELAAAHPDRCFVGLEYTRKKFDKVLRKISRRGGLENLRILHADVTRVFDAIFPPASLERVYVLFPDPWPKKRHQRRRILNPDFVARIATRMAPGALLEARTDNVEYLEQIVEVLGEEPALENATGPDPYLLEPLDPEQHFPTLFERKFRERGLPIHHFYYRRRG